MNSTNSRIFYQELITTYGEAAKNSLKMINKIKVRIIKQKCRQVFLLRCRRSQLKPKFLKFHTKQITFLNNKLKQNFIKLKNKFQAQILNLAISECIINIKKQEHTLQTEIKKAQEIIHTDTLTKFTEITEQECQRLNQKIKNNLIKKFNTLIEIKRNEDQNKIKTNRKKWVENLSDENIPDNVVEVLSLGPNFALPYNEKNFPIVPIITAVESSIDKIDTEDKKEIREIVCNTLNNFKNKTQKENENLKTLRKKVKETNIFLKNHPNIKVTKADKGNKTVLIQKNQYEQKMDNILKDESTYKIMKRDPTAVHQRKNNNLIQKWSDELLIPLQIAEKIKIRNALPPRIYGLPKIHKEEIPLRPIVNCIQSPYYNLSKHLVSILKNVVGKNNYHIKNTWDFKNFIYDLPISEDFTMLSLDVQSMYTNIPVDLALEVVEKKWNKIKQHTNLPKEEFLNACTLCLTSTYFRYEDKFYQQTTGLPMGGPLSATVANLVLEELEESSLKKCNFPVLFYKRYVDDIITAVPLGREEDIKNAFDSFHEKIKFTTEKEIDGKINFLDITLIRRENKITTQWYQKNTSSGRYLNHASSAPKTLKKNVIANLTSRALQFTNPSDRPAVIKNLKNTLHQNGYANQEIDPIIKKETHKLYNTRDQKTEEFFKANETIISLPYIQGATEQLQKKLRPYKIKIVNKPADSFKKFYSNLKTRIDKEKTTHTVYEIECKECRATYVGQSKQYLEKRKKQHESSIKDKSNDNKTALQKHAHSTNHTFDFANIKILDKEQNDRKRCVLEMIRIKQNKNTVNDRRDTEGLSNYYNKLITHDKKRKNPNSQRN